MNSPTLRIITVTAAVVIALQSTASGADNCKAVEYADHIEIDCTGTPGASKESAKPAPPAQKTAVPQRQVQQVIPQENAEQAPTEEETPATRVEPQSIVTQPTDKTAEKSNTPLTPKAANLLKRAELARKRYGQPNTGNPVPAPASSPAQTPSDTVMQ